MKHHDRSINPPVRLGFIGAGNWATSNHMPLLKARDDVEFAAVCTLGEAALQRVQAQFAFPFATEDYRAVLERPLDAVIITTPPGLHYQQARAALESGLHVMVEKPLALHKDEAWTLVTMAEQAGLHLLVPYGWHYRPMVETAREWMQRGCVGTVEFVQCHMASALRHLYSNEQWRYPMENVPDPEARTYTDPQASGGGQGIAQLSHALGLALWLTDLRAQQVYATMSAPNTLVDLYDVLNVRFEGGAIGAFTGAGSLPPSRPRHQLDIRIFGSDGVLLLDLERERLEILHAEGDPDIVRFLPGDGAYQCDGPPHRFVDLILGRATNNPSSGRLAARAVEILDAAYRSVSSGRAEQVAA